MKNMKIVLATSNEHKVQEINGIVRVLSDDKYQSVPIEFVLPPKGFNPIEDGSTFEENSKIKALAAWEISKTWSLADDSGLCINALNGNPGIYSARYAETPEKRIERVLNEMRGIKDRSAAFNCAMTLVNPEGETVYTCKGICEGSITETPAGTNGFGYDPIFLLKDDKRTIAELSEDEKNKVSHRSKALTAMIEYIFQNIK